MDTAKAALREKFTEKQAFLKKTKKKDKKTRDISKKLKPPLKRIRKRRANKT